jgi:two-component system, OmpR family, sensor histidine kinase KdpD
MHASLPRRLLRLPASALIIALVTWIAYASHAKSFVAGFLYLFPVMLLAFGWGFFEATFASVLAVGCLDYFFTEPLLQLSMSDPQDWLALTGFESVVLLVSGLAVRLKRQATEADHQRSLTEKLFLMSRNILLLDHRNATGPQLAKLIIEIFGMDGVSLWDGREARIDTAGASCIPDDELRAAYFQEQNEDDSENGRYKRVLLLGSRSIGAIGLVAHSSKEKMDARTVDAIASLSALTLERLHAFLAESHAEASKHSEQLRSALLDGLAHAFKTPLATIQTASSGLLDADALTPEQRELISTVNNEAIRLDELTTQALRTAKLDYERLKLHKEKIALEPFLRDFPEQSARNLGGHPLAVVNEGSEAVIWADLRLLQMALMQLLDNASKYAEPGSPIILSAATTDTETVFSVINEGSYIAPEESLRIFQRFYRSPGSQYRAPGTGIGLSVVKRIVEAHNGRVWVESDLEAGTKFYLTLPLIRKEV